MSDFRLARIINTSPPNPATAFVGLILSGGQRPNPPAAGARLATGYPAGVRQDVWVEGIYLETFTTGAKWEFRTYDNPTGQGDQWGATVQPGFADGDTLILDRSVSGWKSPLGITDLTFELDDNGSWTAGNIPVDITGLTTEAQVAAALAAKCEELEKDHSVYFPYHAYDGGANTVIFESYDYFLYNNTPTYPGPYGPAMLTDGGGGAFVVNVGASRGVFITKIELSVAVDGGQTYIPIQKRFHNGLQIWPTTDDLSATVKFRYTGPDRQRPETPVWGT